jgi:hypothetical protein
MASTGTFCNLLLVTALLLLLPIEKRRGLGLGLGLRVRVRVRFMIRISTNPNPNPDPSNYNPNRNPNLPIGRRALYGSDNVFITACVSSFTKTLAVSMIPVTYGTVGLNDSSHNLFLSTDNFSVSANSIAFLSFIASPL